MKITKVIINNSTSIMEGEIVYFVIETKDRINNLRPTENTKIESVKKYFEVIQVNYQDVNSYKKFVSLI